MNKETLDWSDVDALVKKLAKKILFAPKNYNALYGIPRGGINVAQELSHYVNLPVTSKIREDTLIIDDIVDSGETLSHYSNNDSAVLHYKVRSKVRPTYYVDETDKWITYPWEVDEESDEGLQKHITRLLEFIGEDPTREGLIETPKRAERAWKFWTKGYQENPADIMKTFTNPGLDQLIIIPKIDFYSMCEHHLAPFYGQIYIGYLPKDKVLGLSKFARLADIYARRLQIQEGLTQQIANEIMNYLEPQGVAVVIKGVHLCMRSRGVEKQNAEMLTSVMLGKFRDEHELRSEFLEMIK